MAGDEPKRKATKRRAKKVPSGNVVHRSGLVTRKAVVERARPFKSLWENRVLLGYLNLLIGEEGIGKGTLIAWIAARVTCGDLPGDLYGTPRQVLIVGDEDSFDHVWVPRMAVADADTELVEYVVQGPTGTFDVRSDAEHLEAYIEEHGTALIYFDQLLDNLGHVNSWKDKEVRDALAPLSKVAQNTGAAMLAAMHPNKRGGSFRERISGTPAFNALSRSSLLVAPHPDGSERRVVVRGKGNYTAEPPAFEFAIESRGLTVQSKRKKFLIPTSRICEERESAVTRDEVLAANRATAETSIARAVRDLQELLADGKEHAASDVIEEMKRRGYPERKTHLAATDAGVERRREQRFQGGALWRLSTGVRRG